MSSLFRVWMLVSCCFGINFTILFLVMVQKASMLPVMRIKFVFIVTQAQMESMSVSVMMMTVMESRNFRSSFLIGFGNIFFVLLGLQFLWLVWFCKEGKKGCKKIIFALKEFSMKSNFPTETLTTNGCLCVSSTVDVDDILHLTFFVFDDC